MQHILGYRCTLCGAELPYTERMTCPHCGEKGILDIIFDYAYIKKHLLSRESLAACRDNSMWRYKALMPLKDRDFSPFLRVGWTPLYPSRRLGPELGLKALYIKDDGLNPTASLKDRASGVAVAKAVELGYDTIACSSTGNAASSCAGNAARMGVKTVIFVPSRAPEGKVAQLMIFGAKVVSVQGDYKATFDLSKAAIEKYGWYNRNAGINPILTEGKKTVALEIAEQLNWQPTDWVACSVGDGCTIGGVYNGFTTYMNWGSSTGSPRSWGYNPPAAAPLWMRPGREGTWCPPRRIPWRIPSPWGCPGIPRRLCGRYPLREARGSPCRTRPFWIPWACWAVRRGSSGSLRGSPPRRA